MHESSELIKELVDRKNRTKDTIVSKKNNQNELELLIMQKTLGNRMTAMMIENQEDQEQIRGLSVPVKEKSQQNGTMMKQYATGSIANDVDEQVQKVGELSFPTGIVHVGCNQEDDQLILVTEEKREDNRREPLHKNQKQVNKHKPVMKSEQTLSAQSQNWNNGAVAIIDTLHKGASRTLKTTKQLIKKEDHTGNLLHVLPFLDQDKEVQEKTQWNQVNEHLKQQERSHRDEKVHSVRSNVERVIDNKNRIIDKKKGKEQEFSKKINRELREAKSKSMQLDKDDFFGLIASIRRKKMQEDEGVEPETSQALNESVDEHAEMSEKSEVSKQSE